MDVGGNHPTVGWPDCGETDIMEIVGNAPNTCNGTLHWADANNEYASHTGSTNSSSSLHDEFHVYSIIWDATTIRWFLNDVQFHVINISGPSLNEFHQDFFFIFNVAVGGNWPGSPNSSTVFPQRMIVDYVRVFQ